MKYMLLIYGKDAARATMTPADFQTEMQSYFAYNDQLRTAGVYIAGDALHGASTATTVRLRRGERLVTDGPFAETTEQLGGYYIIECQNLDEALEWAAKLPVGEHGSVEVRAVAQFD